jgi:hypothetical protein
MLSVDKLNSQMDCDQKIWSINVRVGAFRVSQLKVTQIAHISIGLKDLPAALTLLPVTKAKSFIKLTQLVFDTDASVQGFLKILKSSKIFQNF